MDIIPRLSGVACLRHEERERERREPLLLRQRLTFVPVKTMLLRHPHSLSLSPFSLPRSISQSPFSMQGSAKRWAPGCVNAAGKARRKWQATAATIFTKLGDRFLAEPCTYRACKPSPSMSQPACRFAKRQAGLLTKSEENAAMKVFPLEFQRSSVTIP